MPHQWSKISTPRKGLAPPPDYFTWVLPTRLSLIECASITFGIIRHYRHNFHRFSENSTASIILLFALISENSLKFLTRTTNHPRLPIFGKYWISVLHLYSPILCLAVLTWNSCDWGRQMLVINMFCWLGKLKTDLWRLFSQEIKTPKKTSHLLAQYFF